MSVKDSKIVMICENHSDFKINKEGKDYVLEGVLAELGIENGNGRIYEEKEYLPHLEYLKKRIEKGNLLGELDHPEKFDISLQKVSHMIEHLEYNPDKRQVRGRIRLLNTDAGKNAKAMIDDGVSLSISSRAAGVVKENKKVQIKKIFTYDLVAEPGFENAQLSLMNDSLGISEDSSLKIYEMDNITSDMLSWLIESDSSNEDTNIETLKLENKNNLDVMANEKTNNKDHDENFVTVAQMDKYSQVIKEKIDLFEKTIIDKDIVIDELKNEIEKYKIFSNYLVETLNDKMEEVSEVNEKVEKLMVFSDYIAEHTDNLIEFGNSIAERTNEIHQYTEYLTENLDTAITEQQNIIKFVDYIGDSTDAGIQFTEHVAENLKVLSEHSDYLTEHINNLANYSDYISEKLDDSISYSEKIVETINNGEINTNIKVNENKKIDDLKEQKTLSEKIDSILENVKKQNTDSVSKQIVFGFNLLSEQKQREFLLLENEQKQRIINAANNAKPVTEEHFIKIWEEALNPITADKIMENIVNEMPNEYKNIWENLDEKSKAIILQQASMYKLKTPYQIRNFWQTRSFLTDNNLSIQKLNEDLTADKIKGNENSVNENKVKTSYSGYSNEHISSIGNILKKKI